MTTWLVAFCSLTFNQCIIKTDFYAEKEMCYQQVAQMYEQEGIGSYLCIPTDEDKVLYLLAD